MLKLICLALLVSGFIVPWLMHAPFSFSFIFFWSGLLLLLRTKKQYPETPSWTKWARIGILLNMVVTVSSMILVRFEKLDLFHNIEPIFNPFGQLVRLFSPASSPITMIVPGEFIVFFTIMAYIGLAVLLGKVINKQSSREHGTKSA